MVKIISYEELSIAISISIILLYNKMNQGVGMPEFSMLIEDYETLFSLN